MRVLIVEDETPAARRLERLILEVTPEAQLLKHIDSVEEAVEFFESGEKVDLVFLDIQLADGISFDIFSKTKVTAPVIFTTAYDHYALKAFKVNSVDYLLKPVEIVDLQNAISKYKNIFATQKEMSQEIAEVIKNISLKKDNFRKRFLVKTAGRLAFVNIEDVSFLFSDDGNSFLVTKQNDRFLIDEILEEIETQLDPQQFFRINRKMLLALNSIKRIEPHFNNRFLITTDPVFDEEIIVSRQRSSDFRKWLDS